MSRRIAVFIVVFVGCYALAQRGIAPQGYYPNGYSGDTFTGIITAVNTDTREITLTYTKKQKTEDYEVQMSDFRVGDQMIAYYMPKDKKVDGKKMKYYEIFRFTLSRPAKAS